MTWDAATRTIDARVAAVVNGLPALLATAGLPAIAPDTSTDSDLAVYDSPRQSYLWPCVQVEEVSGSVEQDGAVAVTEFEGLVTLSFQTTDPESMRELWTGYLTALVRCFQAVVDTGDGILEVTQAGATPPLNDESTFVQGVAVSVKHTLAEPV